MGCVSTGRGSGAGINQVMLWLSFSILLGIFSFFLSAYIIGQGSFAFLGIPPITLVVVSLGMFLGGYIFVFAPLQPDWKAQSTRKLIFLSKVISWNISLFQGLGSKKQDLLDWVIEDATKIGFQRIDEIKGRFWGEERYFRGSDLIFESPEGGHVGVRAVAVGNDLRVGFNSIGRVTIKERGKAWAGLLFSILVGFCLCVLSIYIIGHGEIPWVTVPRWMMFIPVALLFLGFSVTFIIILKLAFAKEPQIKEILLRAGKSMGSKQASKFRRIYVRYE